MAWGRRSRSAGTYFYEGKRVGSKVVKVYRGAGAAAQAAARAVAARRADRERVALAASELTARRQPAESLLDQQYDAVMALATAALYAAGYWRPSRHGWRGWREGLRELRVAG